MFHICSCILSLSFENLVTSVFIEIALFFRCYKFARSRRKYVKSNAPRFNQRMNANFFFFLSFKLSHTTFLFIVAQIRVYKSSSAASIWILSWATIQLAHCSLADSQRGRPQLFKFQLKPVSQRRVSPSATRNYCFLVEGQLAFDLRIRRIQSEFATPPWKIREDPTDSPAQ